MQSRVVIGVQGSDFLFGCWRQVLLVHPVTTLLMMGTVAAVIVFLVGGELWILDLRFNE